MDFLSKIDPQSLRTAERVLAGIGLAYAIPTAWRVLSFGWLYFLRPSSLSKYLLPNAYAIVTGASDGIGRGFAKELATRGFNVVLHGRNQAKLDKVAADIRAAHPSRKVRTVIADAADAAGMHAAVARVAAELEATLDGPLTVLVNNCGGTAPQREEFLLMHQMTHKEMDGIIDLNARFHVHITAALLPLINKGTAEARPGLIMYTGSVAGTFPCPWLTTYSPSKMFGNAWIMSVGREMLVTNPHIETLGILVGKVTDTSFYHSAPKFGEPDSTSMAKSALDRVGCGRLNVVGHWQHAIGFSILAAMTEGMQTTAITGVMKKEVQLAIDSKKAK